jgi:hypothetical protein
MSATAALPMNLMNRSERETRTGIWPSTQSAKRRFRDRLIWNERGRY